MGFKLQYKQHVHKNSRIIAEKQGSKNECLEPTHVHPEE